MRRPKDSAALETGLLTQRHDMAQAAIVLLFLLGAANLAELGTVGKVRPTAYAWFAMRLSHSAFVAEPGTVGKVLRLHA